jgi:DNA methylase
MTLNVICPYFTMFPLSFPLSVLERYSGSHALVLDPFCGRGTTNFAARMLGLPTMGIDTSPIAVASTAAKLVHPVLPGDIVLEAHDILASRVEYNVPTGRFWSLAYKPSVLNAICKLREALLENCRSNRRKALRGILLGALHGPLYKNGSSSYFSNQCPRTYAPKPRYAVGFWRRTKFQAPGVDLLQIIQARANRYYGQTLPAVEYRVRCNDSRRLKTLTDACDGRRVKLIITSPPYYGLRTYVSDQWLRNWFLGGPDQVDYSYGVQLSHQSISAFVDDLRTAWSNVAAVSQRGAQLIFRFGAINDRVVEPREIIKSSLEGTPWRLRTIVNAGTARHGKRQADNFFVRPRSPLVEFDAWASKT